MITANFFFNRNRFLNYLRHLVLFYLKKTSSPFLYTGLGYILYAFLHTVLAWTFFSYTMIHTAVQWFFLIILVSTSVKTFSPLYQSRSSLQEYSIPISTEERFLGNFLFYGIVMLGLIYLIHVGGYLILKVVTPEKTSPFTKNIWGDYGSFTLLDYLYIYIFFFPSSIYFRKSPIAKSLIILAIGYIFSFLLFSIPGSIFVQSRWGFSLGMIRNSVDWAPYASQLQQVAHYAFLVTWFIGSYIKLRRSQLCN